MMIEDYPTFIDKFLVEIGGTVDLRLNCTLPMQPEAVDLVSAGPDIFAREQWMTPLTLIRWQAMQLAASHDKIELQLVSAFRSVEYQCQLIRRKVAAGQQLSEIFKVSAIPGFSEHHTGRALDLTSPGTPPLSEAFDKTDAFDWLCRNAQLFDFLLSYPRDNTTGISYEPWHWACNVG